MGDIACRHSRLLTIDTERTAQRISEARQRVLQAQTLHVAHPAPALALQRLDAGVAKLRVAGNVKVGLAHICMHI